MIEDEIIEEKLRVDGARATETRSRRPDPVFMPDSTRNDDDFDWRHTLEILLAGKWLIALFTVGALVVAILVLLLFPPTYKATGLIQVASDKDARPATATGNQGISYDINGNSLVAEGETEVIQSRMVFVELIKRLNLLVDAQPNTFPIIGGAIYRANSGTPQVVGVPDFLRHFAWGGEQIRVEKFEVPRALQNKKYLLRAVDGGYQLMDPDGGVVLEGKVGQLAHNGETSILVKNLRAQWGTTFHVTRVSLEAALTNLTNSFLAEEKKQGSGILELSYKSKIPELAAAVIDNAEEIYLSRNNEWKSSRAAELEQSLQGQLPRLKQQVDQAQRQLNAYQTQHGSVDVSEETQLLLQHGAELETSRLSLMQERDEAVQRFTNNHPMVVGIDDKLRSIDQELEKLKLQSARLPLTQQELLNRTRDLDVANQLYTAMLNTIQQQQVVQAGTLGNVGGNIRIVDDAYVPEKPWFPKPKIILPAGVIVGGVLGVAYVLFRYFLINPFHNVGELERRLGLTVLGRIPFSRAQKKLMRRIKKGKLDRFLLANAIPTDSAVESLRSLRSALHFATHDASNNIITIAGPTAGVGKSFVAINLAALLALSWKRTVIIDADIANGKLCKLLHLESAPGLTDYISDAVAPGGILQQTQIPALTLISHGTRRSFAGELLSHESMTRLLTYLSARFDYVIIDTPGNLTTATAEIVGKFAGCTLLVIKAGANSFNEIEESHRRLTHSGAEVRGVVFNSV